MGVGVDSDGLPKSKNGHKSKRRPNTEGEKETSLLGQY